MSLKYLDYRLERCALCDGEDFAPLKADDRYKMKTKTVGCNKCGLVQINPRPTESSINEFYATDYRRFYQNTLTPTEEYIAQNNKLLRLKYSAGFLSRYAPEGPDSRVLDIGCSEGVMFQALREMGYKCQLHGVEPNRDFADFAERTTKATVFSSINEVSERYDLIIMTHVFEHLHDPAAYLQHLKNILKGDGLLYLDVPDAYNYDSLLHLHIAHLFHFTERTLEQLLIKNGFKVIFSEQHCPPFHPSSIRIVASVDRQVAKVSVDFDSDLEAVTWGRIRELPVYMYFLKKYLAKFKVMRMLNRVRRAVVPR